MTLPVTQVERALAEGSERGEFSRLPITARRYARAGLPLHLLDCGSLALCPTPIQLRNAVGRHAPRGNAVHRYATAREIIAPGQPKGADGQTTMQQYRGTGMDTKQSPVGTEYHSEAGNPPDALRVAEGTGHCGIVLSENGQDHNDPASGVVFNGATQANGYMPDGAAYPDSPVPKTAPYFDTRTIQQEDRAHMGQGYEDQAQDDLLNIPDGVMSRPD